MGDAPSPSQADERIVAAEGILSVVSAARARIGALALRHLSPAQHLALARMTRLGEASPNIRLLQQLVNHRLPEAIRGTGVPEEPGA